MSNVVNSCDMLMQAENVKIHQILCNITIKFDVIQIRERIFVQVTHKNLAVNETQRLTVYRFTQ